MKYRKLPTNNRQNEFHPFGVHPHQFVTWIRKPANTIPYTGAGKQCARRDPNGFRNRISHHGAHIPVLMGNRAHNDPFVVENGFYVAHHMMYTSCTIYTQTCCKLWRSFFIVWVKPAQSVQTAAHYTARHASHDISIVFIWTKSDQHNM